MLIATDEYMVAKQSAIELFENGKYKEAFYIFAGLYNQIEDSEERNWIHSILMDAYYLPNKDEQKNLYQKNVKLLESYPYFYGNLKGENQYLFCLTSEEEVGIYDAIKKEWIEYATVQTEHCTKNLFAQLEVDENSVGGYKNKAFIL